MVKWVNAQNFGSDIGAAIREAGAMLYGDTLTPALKQEQLTAAQNQNDGLANFQEAVRTMGRIPGTPNSGPATGVRQPQVPNVLTGPTALRGGIESTAQALGMDPVDLATIISYETAGTFDPLKAGPTTQWGQHRGLIQFGEPQAKQYGVNWDDPVNSQLGPDGAVARYFRENGWQPGMSFLDAYSIVNAGAPGRYNASDAHNGGMPGTVRDKVENQMADHRAIAQAAFTGAPAMAPPTASPFTGAPSTDPGAYNPQSPQMFAELLANGVAAGMSPQEAAEAALFMSANAFGAENQATVNAAVGAGGSYEDTYSGFAQDQNRQMWETGFNDANEMVDVIRNGVPLKVRKSEMLVGDAPIMSNTEVQGMFGQQVFDQFTPEERNAYLGAEPKNVQQADSFVTPDGQVIPSIDGLTDARTGAPLPAGSIKTTITAQSRESAELARPVVTGLQNQVIGLESFRGQIAAAREVATADPTLFGITGQVRTGLQNLGEQFRQLQATAPETATALESDVDNMMDTILGTQDPDGVVNRFMSDVYDPNLSALDLYGKLLPYAAAAALAQQEGRGLSNQDVERFASIIGNPTGLWSTQRNFLTRLDLLDREINRLLTQSRSMLENGVQTTVPTGVQPGVERIGNVSDGAPRQLSDTDVQTMPIDELLNSEVPLTPQQLEILDRRLKEAESLLGAP
jgi:hypothetical protein